MFTSESNDPVVKLRSLWRTWLRRREKRLTSQQMANFVRTFSKYVRDPRAPKYWIHTEEVQTFIKAISAKITAELKFYRRNSLYPLLSHLASLVCSPVGSIITSPLLQMLPLVKGTLEPIQKFRLYVRTARSMEKDPRAVFLRLPELRACDMEHCEPAMATKLLQAFTIIVKSGVNVPRSLIVKTIEILDSRRSDLTMLEMLRVCRSLRELRTTISKQSILDWHLLLSKQTLKEMNEASISDISRVLLELARKWKAKIRRCELMRACFIAATRKCQGISSGGSGRTFLRLSFAFRWARMRSKEIVTFIARKALCSRDSFVWKMSAEVSCSLLLFTLADLLRLGARRAAIAVARRCRLRVHAMLHLLPQRFIDETVEMYHRLGVAFMPSSISGRFD